MAKAGRPYSKLPAGLMAGKTMWVAGDDKAMSSAIYRANKVAKRQGRVQRWAPWERHGTPGKAVWWEPASKEA